MKIRIMDLTDERELNFRLKTLTPEELQSLLQVPTTSEQAATIEKRNKCALKQLNNMKQGNFFSEEIPIECPHCNNMQCEWDKYCGWSKYVPLRRKADEIDRGDGKNCLIAEFGGVDYTEAECIELCPQKLRLEGPVVDFEESSIENSRIYLEGHIEWAEIIQALGPDGTTGRKLKVIQE